MCQKQKQMADIFRGGILLRGCWGCFCRLVFFWVCHQICGGASKSSVSITSHVVRSVFKFNEFVVGLILCLGFNINIGFWCMQKSSIVELKKHRGVTEYSSVFKMAQNTFNIKWLRLPVALGLSFWWIAWTCIEFSINQIWDLYHLNKAAPFCILRQFKLPHFLFLAL